MISHFIKVYQDYVPTTTLTISFIDLTYKNDAVLYNNGSCCFSFHYKYKQYVN